MRTTFPPIVMGSRESVRLANLANAGLRTSPAAAEVLLHEVARAQIDDRLAQSGGVVTMNSYVEFRDDVTGRVRTIKLVYPSDSDPDAGAISVLTPVGAALIGLLEGQSFEWRTRRGDRKTLTVLKVRNSVAPLGYIDV